MAFELIKLVMMPTYWRLSVNREKHMGLVILEIFYLAYLIGTFFMGYWYIGLGVLLVSMVTAVQLSDDYIEKAKYNKQIKNYLLTDGIVSIIIMSVVIFKEFLL
jgi:hypothetical protein